MAVVPIISQTWDTTSVFNPTRMNNIETNIATVSNATGVKYDNNNSVKDMLDCVSLTITRTNNSYVSSLSDCQAKKIGKERIFTFNLSVSGSATSDWVKIGEITNWNASGGMIVQVVCQNATFKMCTVRVSSEGNIYIFTPMALNDYVRGNLIAFE